MNNTPIEQIIGNNLRYLRTNTFKECKNKKQKVIMKHITQMDLGNYLNVTFQQIQKYENNVNNLDAIKIFKLSKFFGVPMECFFDETLSEKKTFAKLITENEQQGII